MYLSIQGCFTRSTTLLKAVFSVRNQSCFHRRDSVDRLSHAFTETALGLARAQIVTRSQGLRAARPSKRVASSSPVTISFSASQ